MLFLILFLHQTTTPEEEVVEEQPLFLILFLHQTTTAGCLIWLFPGSYTVLTVNKMDSEAPAKCI